MLRANEDKKHSLIFSAYFLLGRVSIRNKMKVGSIDFDEIRFVGIPNGLKGHYS